MASRIPQSDPDEKLRNEESHGLALWMPGVVEEVAELQGRLRPRHIHDLRVALRRCRSVAGGFEQLDPHPAWPRMRKAAKRLLIGVGGIRDIHVMREWIALLGMSKSEAGLRLSAELDQREHRARRKARKALKTFDGKQWRKWTRELVGRVQQIAPVTPAFDHVVLERWQAAWELHRVAMRVRSKVSFHRLRVGIKRFRYSVDSFMPDRATEWGRELKSIQDLLGEVHDLDVFWDALLRVRPRPRNSEIEKWRRVIELGRKRRLAVYKEKMGGTHSLWSVWRSALPPAPANRPAPARRGK
jgi:CHAD domain-containing protein